MNALPFHDRTGEPEHMRPVYGPHLTLDEIERRAYAAGDFATLALIDQLSDEIGLKRSEAVERAVAMRASVQEAATAEARIAELQAVIAVLRDKQRLANDLLCAVQFVLLPYRHAPQKPAPKWAKYLIDTLSRVYNLEPY